MYINRDMTFNERLKFRELRAELETRSDTGESVTFLNGRGFPVRKH